MVIEQKGARIEYYVGSILDAMHLTMEKESTMHMA